MTNTIKKFLLDTLFPEFCFGCNKEGRYLCKDCKAVLDISQYCYCLCKKPKILSSENKCPECQHKKLDGLYSVTDYQNPLIKLLIQKFKYEPFIKELSKIFALLIVDHLQLLDNKPDFADFILIPIPLDQRRLKWRGFNQAAEITKELSKNLDLPLVLNCLVKIKKTMPQVELSEKERKENIEGIFHCQNNNRIFNKKILLVDDVYTTGATMEAAAFVLKESGAQKVLGITIARE